MSDPRPPETPDSPETPGSPDFPARPAEPAEPEHRPDGLELARDLTRSTAAGRAGTPARRRRTGTTPEDRRRDRGAGAGELRRGQISGAHPDERDPQLIDGELSKLVDQRGWELPLRMRGVFARWPDLVGAEIAQHSQPASFVDGVLTVRTDSTAWATQLRLLTPQVLRRVNDDLGDGTVRVLEVQGPQAPGWGRGQRRVRGGRGPRDTYG